jgi:hypothetical protein
MWAMIIMIIRSDVNMYILGKYVRVVLSTIFVIIICNKLRITSHQIIGTLSVIFGIHVISLLMQSVFPQLDIPMAKFFGFEREISIVSEYTLRKLGCSTSYDTASQISVLSMVFYFLLYIVKNKNIFLIFTLISLFACTKSSRFGMVLAILFFAIMLIIFLFNSKGKNKLLPLSIFLFGIAYTIYIILPIFAYSTDSFLTTSQFNNKYVENYDYTVGTVDGLSSSHLAAMNSPFFDLLIGFGIDPNKVTGLGTDIGYVKLIYQIGIIGLILILMMYRYIYKWAIIYKKISAPQSDEFILSSFIVLYISVIMLMNFKSLEMYSRGCHDLLLIIFFVLLNSFPQDNAENVKTSGYSQSVGCS